jgi:hypothetical protein
MKNGAATATGCTIAAGTGCLDASGCVDLAAGDEIAVEAVGGWNLRRSSKP